MFYTSEVEDLSNSVVLLIPTTITSTYIIRTVNIIQQKINKFLFSSKQCYIELIGFV